ETEIEISQNLHRGNARYAPCQETRGPCDLSSRRPRGVLRHVAGPGKLEGSDSSQFSSPGRIDPRAGCNRVSAPAVGDPKKQLRRVMGFWDVLLFNIATVLGPRWIAAAAHNGTSSISLWVLAALFFFVPSAFVITELSTRFPREGGLYVWSKEAFGDFHGFVAGWTYWIYTFFYFPGLLLASAAMSAYVGGAGTASMAENKTYLLVASFAMLFLAVFLNIIGLHVVKWVQNAGGIGT